MSPAADLLLGLATALAVFLLPPILGVGAVSRVHRSTPMSLLPIAIIGVATFFTAAALLSRAVSYGLLLFSLSCGMATLVCVIATRRWRLAGEQVAVDRRLATAALLMLATLGIADCVYIYLSQSWAIDGRVAGVVSPMQLDPQRNTNLSTALLRGSDTVFLPGSRILYQLLWYHGAAAILAVLPESVTRYYQVAGIALGTGWLLYATLLWTALRLLPRLPASLMVAVLAAGLVLLDMRLDDTGLFRRLYEVLHPAGVPAPYFQYFSVKLLVLTAPQHAMFFVFFVMTVYFRLVEGPAPALPRSNVWLPFCVASLLASPILSALVFPAFAVSEFAWMVLRQQARRLPALVVGWLLAVVIAFLLHYLAVGFSPHELFSREGAVELRILGRDRLAIPLRLLPMAVFLTSGLVGVVFVAVIGTWILTRKRAGAAASEDAWIPIVLLTAACGFLLWNIVVSEVELRRHFSMALTVLITLATLPVMIRLLRDIPARTTVPIMIPLILLGVLLEARFLIKNSSARNNVLSVDIPWKDYFAASAYLRSVPPVGGVIAASGDGIVLPIVNEVATALAPKLAILAHQRVTPEMRQLLSAEEDKGAFTLSDLDESWVEATRKQGFDTVIWGPVEEAKWGLFGRALLLENADLVGEFGEVLVFRRRAPGSTGASDVAANAISRVACAARMRLQLRQEGTRLEYAGGSYRLLDLAQTVTGTLPEVWARLGKRPCTPEDVVPSTAQRRPSALPDSTVNLAMGAVAAIQSSTIRPEIENAARNAVDGRLDGFDETGNVRIVHTQRDHQAWWEVDLGQEVDIKSVQIWGRHPSFGRRMKNVVVEIRREPRSASGLADELMVPGAIRSGDVIEVNRRGRFVRLHLAGDGYFVASEIQVWAR